MAELPIFSSQSSHFDQHQIKSPDADQENVPASPSRAYSERLASFSSQKPKKSPTVTPKRFTKFFTPRSTLSGTGRGQSKAGRQLRDITKNGVNRRRTAPALLHDEDDVLSATPNKRRKMSLDVASSPPLRSSPLKHVSVPDQIPILDEVKTPSAENDGEDPPTSLEQIQSFPKPIRRLRQAGPSQRILQRSFGGCDALARGRRGVDHCADWRADTANFVTSPSDVHAFKGAALPFCAASCNTNSLVAIGDEEGGVRLVDSTPDSDFTKAHVQFRPHRNAIMDITFSSDDFLLATSSGDQTVRIVDMPTQQVRCILTGHKSSVKQVVFRPGDDNLLTTSGRDGSVQLWDLRCSSKTAVHTLRTSLRAATDPEGISRPPALYAKDIVNVGAAHRSSRKDVPQAPNTDPNVPGVSITSIQHLPYGREHILLTASEVSASIKLWDLRQAGRRNGSTAVSSTPLPHSHRRTRNFGLNAMMLSGDGARLYTVCRDATIYAYSTNHLLLGSAPELSASSSSRRAPKDTKTSVAPLYGFRHPQFKTGSFYVKASLRPPKDDKSEMLAVGSSENCVVLFPTDERHLPHREVRHDSDDAESEDEADLPSFPPSSSQQAAKPDSLSVHGHGTVLIRAHNKEVTSMVWTLDGALVTISDDFSARCWREDVEKARELRGCGEGGGKRWGYGWADVGGESDEDDGRDDVSTG